MVASDIAALGGALTSLVSIVENLGDNYFVADAAWHAFPSRVRMLAGTHLGLMQKLRSYGFRGEGSQFADLIRVVHDAKDLLDMQVAELKKRSGCKSQAGASSCLRIRHHICGMLFPSSVEAHIRVAEQAYKNILDYIQTQHQLDDALRGAVRKQNFRLPYRWDPRYVPRKALERKICDALNHCGQDPAAVLVHGGPGTGKSAAAKHISLQYQEGIIFSTCNEIDVIPGGNSSDESGTRINAKAFGDALRQNYDCTVFTQVVMLECGPQVNVPDALERLVLLLGADLPQADDSKLSAVDRNGPLTQLQSSTPRLADDLSRRSYGDRVKVWKTLQTLLSVPSVLIFLDDLWEADLINELVNLSGQGSGAKFIVTSQRGNLCNELSCCVIPVHVASVDQSEARNILALHACLEDPSSPRLQQDLGNRHGVNARQNPFPQALQEVADEIIQKSERNPLVLAILGAHIAAMGKEKFEKRRWDALSEEFLQLLSDENNLIRIHGYQGSFVASMMIAFNALSEEQKEIFVLIGMSGSGESNFIVTSKCRLEMLYTCYTAVSKGGCRRSTFVQSCSDLQHRNLVFEARFEDGQPQLSMHFLTKKFIREHLPVRIARITRLLRDSLDHDRSVDCESPALPNELHAYDDPELRKRYGSLIPLLTYCYIDSDLDIYGWDKSRSKKKLVNRFIRLAVDSDSLNMGAHELGVLSKVLLQFVTENRVDQDAILELLASPTSVIPTLTVLMRLPWPRCSLGGKGRNHCPPARKLLHSLLELLRDDSSPDQQDLAATVLLRLSSQIESKDAFAVASTLVANVAQVQNPPAQDRVLLAVSNLDKNDVTHGPGIADFPGFLDATGAYLSKDDNSRAAQRRLAKALSNVTCKIRDQGASRLFGLSFVEHASIRVGNIAGMGTDLDQRACLVSLSLLQGLAKSLNRHEDKALQTTACRTVANIAAASDSTGRRLLLDPSSGILTALMNCLVRLLHEIEGGPLQRSSTANFRRQNANLLRKLVDALCQLSKHKVGDPDTFRLRISDWIEVVKGLAKVLSLEGGNWLSKTWHLDCAIQHAASTLANLSFRTQVDPAEMVVRCDGLVNNLMTLTTREHPFDARPMESARALINLTHFTGSKVKATTKDFDLLLGRLVASSLRCGDDHVFTFLEEQEASASNADGTRDGIKDLQKLLCRMFFVYHQETDVSVRWLGKRTLAELRDKSRDGVLWRTVRGKLFLLCKGRLPETILSKLVNFCASNLGEVTLEEVLGSCAPDEAALGKLFEELDLVDGLVKVLYENPVTVTNWGFKHMGNNVDLDAVVRFFHQHNTLEDGEDNADGNLKLLIEFVKYTDKHSLPCWPSSLLHKVEILYEAQGVEM